MKYLKYLTIFGDALYILWILYNGIDDGFAHIFSVQAVVILGLLILLSLNIFMLCKRMTPKSSDTNQS